MRAEMWRVWPERQVSTPTQEEGLSAVEHLQVRVDEAVSDLNHHVIILIGIVQKQEWDIREIKGSLRAIDGRLNSLESRFETQEHRIENLGQRVNSRFDVQDKKLDQIFVVRPCDWTISEVSRYDCPRREEH